MLCHLLYNSVSSKENKKVSFLNPILFLHVAFSSFFKFNVTTLQLMPFEKINVNFIA